LDEPGKFPDVSNNRYGCYTYAAAEVVCFHSIIQSLITETIDGKTKSNLNHVEKYILIGLNCPVTMTAMVALALYGVSVSWPYMAQVRGTKEKIVNLLSLTDLHRKLPVF
jgi:heme/copper-type cytochrome/quinol oxidase subunit 3